ncbi:unnamed protein product [Spodoptera exigua]|nr:unnamed protein product [Spodoptera exigua]
MDGLPDARYRTGRGCPRFTTFAGQSRTADSVRTTPSSNSCQVVVEEEKATSMGFMVIDLLLLIEIIRLHSFTQPLKADLIWFPMSWVTSDAIECHPLYPGQ